MKENPRFRIGHLKIVDHLILGITDLQLKSDDKRLTCSTFETIAMNSWRQICDSLATGSINGAFITLPLAMDLFASGLDIRMLLFTHRGGSLIVKNRRINTLSDFKGRTVLVPSELSIQNMLLHRFLSAAGLTLGTHDDQTSEVRREVATPFLMSKMLGSDQDDDIAGFAVAEPFGSQAVHEGIADELCPSGNLWKNHPCCAFILNASLINQYPDAVEEIVSLFVLNGKWIESCKEAEILITAKNFLGQTKEITRHVLSGSGISFDPSLLGPDIKVLDTIQNYMADTMGILPNKINLNRFVDDSFFKKQTVC